MRAGGAELEPATAGWGITRARSYQVADALADGTLIEMFGAWENRRTPVHLVHFEGRRPAAKTRAFVDFATRRLRADPSLLAAG